MEIIKLLKKANTLGQSCQNVIDKEIRNNQLSADLSC